VQRFLGPTELDFVSIDAIASAAAGPFAAACVVLAVAGIAKLRRPVGTRPAAAALGLPASPGAVRALGVFELAFALAGLALGGAAAAMVAAVYGALAVAAARLLVRAPGTACGCLGVSDAPVSPTHIVVNVVAAAAALCAAAGGPPFASVSGAGERVAFVLLVGCCAALVTAVLDVLPTLRPSLEQGEAG
jgi:hypothetical protein